MEKEIRIGTKVYKTTYARLLRPLNDEEYQALKASITAQGITSPIVVTEDGEVLDGLHRLRIASELGLPPSSIPTVVVPGLSPEERIARAVALNAARRQLSKDELKELVISLRKEHRLSYPLIEQATGVHNVTAMRWCDEQVSTSANEEVEIPAKILSADGKERPSERLSPEDLTERRRRVRQLREQGYTLEEIAEELGISVGTVHADLQAGAVVLTTAAKDHRVAKALETGVIMDRPVASDTDLLRAARQRQREILRLQDQERVSGSAETLEELIEAGRRFATIVLDPPWDWDDEEDHDQFGRGRPAYALLPYEKLLDLPISELAEENAHLYLWITCRSLPKGFGLLREWGFRYITTLTWCKPTFGMGNYFRGSTEHVLFGVRGSLPLRRHDIGTWFQAERGPDGHSSKPQEFFDLVESCSPGPYLEMFARRERPGWMTWGPLHGADGASAQGDERPGV